MLTVETDPVAVEERLRSGAVGVSGMRGCAGRVGPCSGSDGPRHATAGLWIVPRRSRCTGCRATHVLLPVLLLVRRADTAAVIGAGLTAKATGAGHRLIAALLGRPPETVRGWLRRFAGRVEAVRAVFTRWCRDAGAGSGAARAGRVGVGGRDRRGPAAAAAVGARFSIGEVPVWQVAVRGLGGPGCCCRAGPLRRTGVDQHELHPDAGAIFLVIIAACPVTDG